MIGCVALVTALVCSAPAPGADPGAPVIAPADFQKWFELAAESRLVLPSGVEARAKQYRYVLLGGLQFGMMQSYLAQNAKALRARGVPAEAIHIINPSSHQTLVENAEAVREELVTLADEGPEKLVVIAHSRGACDTLAFALRNPHFVSDRIEAMFLVQGPFGGTGLADYVCGEGHAIDGRMPLGHRVLGQAMSRLESQLLGWERHQVVSSLSRRSSNRFWTELLEANRQAIPVVSPRTFYVTSLTEPSRHPLLQRTTAWYLNSYYGPNDGLVALEDQSLPELGTVLAVLDAGHTDLTRRFPAARPRKRLRWALTDAVMMAMGTDAKSTPPRDDNLTRTSRREKSQVKARPRVP
jgi:pimeloyl-ACP methyl ester carboxylesterase